MKQRIVLFLSLWVVVVGVACGGTPAGSTPAGSSQADASQTSSNSGATTAADPAAELTELTAEEDAAIATALATTPESASGGDATALENCEEYFRFCVAATLSGAVESVGAGGMGANIDTCAVWATPGEARILELPMMQNAGDDAITVALTRIAAYTGPGRYELQAVATEGIPDMFPAIVAAGRTFNNGDGSTAVVTINADGSGTLEAVDLVEIASLQVSNPDPSARVDFAMQWTCQDS